MTLAAVLWCALLTVGCRGGASDCPQATVTANPQEIPDGVNQTALSVQVSNPFPQNGLAVVTEITRINGTVADPSARETTYACAHDASGPVEICVNATYLDPMGQKGEDQGVGASSEYLRTPHVRLSDPLECSETQCMVVTCPEIKNECPAVSSLTVDPMDARENGTATIEVVAEDPDENPEALVTTCTARHGTIVDPNASRTTYECDDEFGGVIEICALASDGDSSCDDEVCTWVRCPGDPSENTCPIIEDLTASRNPIPPGEETTTVRVDAIDPDEFPEPLETTFSSATGAFGDRHASETTFRCGESGPVEVCVEASDGDPTCPDEPRCLTIQCPSDIRPNFCPMLFVINGVPRTVPEGETSTRVQTRGQDTDGLPLPLVLTLNALWGSFENTINIPEPNNVVAQNATYVCDRPGEVEVCVDATDGACVKTLCDSIVCPDTIPTPP
jgi:hypothetical protein